MNELAEITGVKAVHALRGLDSLAASLRDLQLAHSILATGDSPTYSARAARC
jgi:hypothetical protein